jgi:hypothetical protein
MRVILVAVEKLDGEYPGLQRDLDDMLRRGLPQLRIQSLLREKYGVSVPLPQISKYKLKRWIPQRQRVGDYIERAEAMIEVIKRETGRRRLGMKVLKLFGLSSQ